jgi:bifunctional ADP-heptose synthase (sugar kinase/adenylyltransferase)
MLDSGMQKEILAYLAEVIPLCDALIIEDYDKGLLSHSLIKEVLDLAGKYNKIVAVDPKYLNFSAYCNVEIFKPNYRELEMYLGRGLADNTEFERVTADLRQKMNIQQFVVTKGSEGMYLFRGKARAAFTSFAREVYDVPELEIQLSVL